MCIEISFMIIMTTIIMIIMTPSLSQSKEMTRGTQDDDRQGVSSTESHASTLSTVLRTSSSFF